MHQIRGYLTTELVLSKSTHYCLVSTEDTKLHLCDSFCFILDKNKYLDTFQENLTSVCPQSWPLTNVEWSSHLVLARLDINKQTESCNSFTILCSATVVIPQCLEGYFLITKMESTACTEREYICISVFVHCTMDRSCCFYSIQAPTQETKSSCSSLSTRQGTTGVR